MSNTSNAGCVTCRARNKKCDKTRGPNGCRRCTKAGIACEGYLDSSSRIPRPKHNSRGNDTTHHGRPEHFNINLDEIALTVGSSVPQGAGGNNPNAPKRNFDSSSLSFGISSPQQDTGLYPRVGVPHGRLIPPAGQIPKPITQLLSPPTEEKVDTRAPRAYPGGPMSSGQASLFESLLSLADDPPALPCTPESPRSSMVRRPAAGGEQTLAAIQERSLGSHSQIESAVYLPPDLDDDISTDDSETIIVGVIPELTLDPEVESNIVPFAAHAFTSWLKCFIFEPTRAVSLARTTIVRGLSLGPEARQKMILVASTVLAISKSTDHELKHFTAFYQTIVKEVLEARACSELTREGAMKAMASCHELISITSKVASFATILNLLDLYAPVFRRACPEPGDELVNLPRRLTAPEVHLKYYVSFDVLQSVISHRPMLFRYDLKPPSQQDEKLLDADDRPGLRWSIGIPDRLILILARINTLVEDFGSCVDREVVGELEREIGKACKPIVSSTPREDPALLIGRVMIQESWRLAGYVYLFMGLCGADSSDARVVKVQKQFMRLLKTVNPRRNPDLFLVLPLVVMGVATSSPTDQSILLARLWGVSECSKPGTMGNDVSRMLNDIWGRTTKRPAAWSDLRIACLKVTGK